MESNSADIQQLRSRLDALINKQNKLRANVDSLRGEIADLQVRINNLVETAPAKTVEPEVEKTEVPKEPVVQKIVEEKVPEITADKLPPLVKPITEPVQVKQSAPVVSKNEKSSIESFLGENLASKIGIAIILIGIGVGVKYAIDKNILGPAMRILLGYLAGGILIGVALYLKKKYENLSVVMFAGGMAVAYFVTFIGYDFYDLFPKMVAFGSMLVLTVITSIAAIRYDKQIIAIVGLVGAYAVPFLLQDGTGTIFALFVYMTIINGGILFLSYRKNWHPTFYVAFGCTWFIFLVLALVTTFSSQHDDKTLLLFSSIFYVLFYAMVIAHKMKLKEQLDSGGSTIVILNSIFAYTFGVFLVSAIFDDSFINGIFSLIFAASQGLVALMSLKQKETDYRLYYVAFGFALIFATLSIPMMFDGSWISILWSLEAALFFWIGWKKDDKFFEKISYIPLFLALIGVIYSWSNMHAYSYYHPFQNHISPILNEYFLGGLVFTAALFFMTYVKQKSEKLSSLSTSNGLFELLSNSLIYLGTITLYFSIYKEIDIFWEQQESTQAFKTGFLGDYFSSVGKLKTIWVLIFSLIFMGAIQLGNRYFVKNIVLSITIGTASIIAVVAFLVIGLYDMSILRDRSLDGIYGNKIAEYGLTFSIRYIGYAALGFVLWANWYSLRYFFKKQIFKQGMEIIIHVCLVWVACSELIHLKKMNGGGDIYRAGLTIFGGIYSFGLIAYGIWKKKSHLRMLALILFGITLLKLFIYDISKVDSGGKTIAFISLGVLLLVISFLYTKYKHLILTGDDGNDVP